jgi:hypothetical protein
MSTKKTLLTLAAVAVLTTIGIAPASGHADGTTHVDSVAATVGSTIQITGQATFVDIPVQVATDASGDGAIPGTDMTSATISRPDPAKNELKVSMAIANATLPTFTIPEVVHYSFFFGRGVDGGDAQYMLQALRTANVQAPGSAEPFFRVMSFNGATCCNPVQTVAGSMANGKVEWTVPLASIGAATGGLLTAHPVATRQIQIQLGASGQQWLNNGQPDFMTFETEYTIPTRVVQLGIAPAGTAPDAVALTKTATVSASNAFTGSLTLPSAGSYVVVAKACFGPENCGLQSTTVTV